MEPLESPHAKFRPKLGDWITSSVLAALLGIVGTDAVMQTTINDQLKAKAEAAETQARAAYAKLYNYQEGRDDALDTAQSTASTFKWQLDSCQTQLSAMLEADKKAVKK